MTHVISEIRKVEVDILDADGEMVHVRAKQGAPFTIRGSKPPYFTLLIDEAFVRISDLIDEDLPLPEYDAASYDADMAYRMDSDERDYADLIDGCRNSGA